MELWKCVAEEKGLLLPEELEIPVEDILKLTNKVLEPESIIPSDASNYPYIPRNGTLGSQEFTKLGFPDTVERIRQSGSSDPSGNALSDQIEIHSYTEAVSPTCILSNLVSEDKQLGSRRPGLFVESNGLGLETIDLKLGGSVVNMGARDDESSKEGLPIPSNMPCMPTKKARLTSLYSQTPFCQVQGCNKDLSSSKDYHKKHKVCDAHTKTAKVIVNGIEQRFCQQCSRFHLLAEFDDGKRSCRKRLANHNERRRKPQGSRFLSSSPLRRTSFVLHETLPTAFSGPIKHQSGKWFGDIKFEDPTMKSSSFLNFHDDYPARAIEKTAGTVQPSDQYLSHAPASFRALSLLSAQSLNTSNQLLGTAISTPMMAESNYPNCSSAQNFSSSNSIEKFAPSGVNPIGKMRSTTVISYDSVEGGCKVPADGIITGSGTSNYCLSSGQGTVVDLLELSSRLQMVEQKRKLLH